TGTAIDLPIIAALLTLVGYSVNDTIIVCDRIRENRRRLTRQPLSEVVNTSINETLSRTIITSGTTLLVVITLFIFGGGVIHDFAFVLLVGITVGTYSSIFIASPILLLWENLAARRTSAAALKGRAA
ncbi:MAG: protein translocase subunit SecF, partial [Deltaproteobacteria bacterium]|nr:protein translocase subunit SecF [Deltaproteobacteria bacterium]